MEHFNLSMSAFHLFSRLVRPTAIFTSLATSSAAGHVASREDLSRPVSLNTPGGVLSKLYFFATPNHAAELATCDMISRNLKEPDDPLSRLHLGPCPCHVADAGTSLCYSLIKLDDVAFTVGLRRRHFPFRVLQLVGGGR